MTFYTTIFVFLNHRFIVTPCNFCSFICWSVTKQMLFFHQTLYPVSISFYQYTAIFFAYWLIVVLEEMFKLVSQVHLLSRPSPMLPRPAVLQFLPPHCCHHDPPVRVVHCCHLFPPEPCKMPSTPFPFVPIAHLLGRLEQDCIVH